MALFDKLKEKVNKVVDVDKLSEMATKTVDSIKHEVVKAIDPTVKEQERLENERIKEQERLKKEQEHLENERALQAQKEKALEDFLLSINLDDELNYIFSVLEKSGASAITFEKGVEHLLSKNETNLTKSEVLPVLKKELLARAFADNEYAVPMVIAIDYFISDVVKDKLLPLYVRFTVSREGGSYAVMEVPFVKALYGIAGRAFNYLNNKLEQKITN